MAENIRVLERAISILNLLSYESRSFGITEIAEKTSLSKATVHRTLSTLMSHHLVVQDNTQKYHIGPGVLMWSSSYNRLTCLLQIARPFIRELAEEVGETVHLVSYENRVACYIDKIESPHPVGMMSKIGTNISLINTAAGRSILSSLSPDELERFLRERSDVPGEIFDRVFLEKILQRSSEQGFAEDNEENEEGIRCVDSAILQGLYHPIGAVSISVPAYRMTDQKALAYGRKVSQTVHAISEKFGYES